MVSIVRRTGSVAALTRPTLRRGRVSLRDNGLGRAIINFNQQYITGPEKLWAAILVASLLGVTFFVMIRALELVALRGRPGAAEG